MFAATAQPRACGILAQVTIYRRLRIGRMVISTNPKPTIYRKLYENTDPADHWVTSRGEIPCFPRLHN